MGETGGEVYQDIDLYDLTLEKRPGLKVRMEGLSTGDLFGLMGLMEKIPDGAEKSTKLDPESKAAIQSLMETVGTALESWNVADRHGAVRPADLEGLMACKLGLVMDIAMAWMSAQTEVDDDLGKDSSSGTTSALEQSLPMAPRSPNPAN